MAASDITDVTIRLIRLSRDAEDIGARLESIADRLSELSGYSFNDRLLLEQIEAHLTEIERFGVKEEV